MKGSSIFQRALFVFSNNYPSLLNGSIVVHNELVIPRDGARQPSLARTGGKGRREAQGLWGQMAGCPRAKQVWLSINIQHSTLNTATAAAFEHLNPRA